MSVKLIFAHSRHYKFQKKKEETENVSEVIRRPPPLLAPLYAPYGPQYRPPSGPLQTHTPRLPYGPLTGTPMGTTTGPPPPLWKVVSLWVVHLFLLIASTTNSKITHGHDHSILMLPNHAMCLKLPYPANFEVSRSFTKSSRPTAFYFNYLN